MTTNSTDPQPDAVRDSARLAALRETGLLDSESEESFDRLTRLAVKLLGIPAAFISLVDENRDFYKSACGFGEPLASSRELTGVTFCHYAIESDGPLVIPDTRADPVYRQVPTVETLGVAAYVGVPLVLENGHAIGSFCAIDMQPRAWSPTDVEVLTELAASARREVDLRRKARLAQEQAAQLRDLAHELAQQVAETEALSQELMRANRALALASAPAGGRAPAETSRAES